MCLAWGRSFRRVEHCRSHCFSEIVVAARDVAKAFLTSTGAVPVKSIRKISFGARFFFLLLLPSPEEVELEEGVSNNFQCLLWPWPAQLDFLLAHLALVSAGAAIW